jgi:hypothetical protein
MFVVNALSKRGPRPARSERQTVQAALGVAAEMQALGCWHITITDTRDQKPMPLDWWHDALAGAKVGQP